MGEIELARSHSDLRVPRADGTRARLVSLEDAKSVVPPIYDRVRAETPGMFERDAAWWEVRDLADPPDRRNGAGEKNVMVLELDGRDAGYALYRVTAKWEFGSSVGSVNVIEALGTPLWPFARCGASCSSWTGSPPCRRHCCPSTTLSCTCCSIRGD